MFKNVYTDDFELDEIGKATFKGNKLPIIKLNKSFISFKNKKDINYILTLANNNNYLNEAVKRNESLEYCLEKFIFDCLIGNCSEELKLSSI